MLIECKDDQAEHVQKFLDVLDMKKHFIFGDADYVIDKNRQRNLRKPTNLPAEDKIAQVKDHTIKEIAKLMENPLTVWSSHAYVRLRDLVICRLTLYNARRGGEPARLLLEEWEEALTDKWVNRNLCTHFDELETYLLDSTKIAYQMGKQKKLVSILIPIDMAPSLEKLSDQKVRKTAGVEDGNIYLFPFTQDSEYHASGWHSTNTIVSEILGIKMAHDLTATKMRHSTSTLYARADVPPGERELFYAHMGPSETCLSSTNGCHDHYQS